MKPAMRWSEYQQLELLPAVARRHPSWRDRLQRFASRLTAFSSEPIEVWLTRDEFGIWWNACDSRTGRSLRQATEAELRIWIEQHHLH